MGDRPARGKDVTMAPLRSNLTLLADIGGTNTRVARASGGAVDRATIRRYSNAAHQGLDEVLAAYASDVGPGTYAGVCIAVAGPVRNGVAEMTNLDWTIDQDSVARATGAPVVAVVNDLQAQGHALGALSSEALRDLVAATGETSLGTAQLVVGIGTGFNAAPVHYTHGGRLVAASECGHISLPVRTDADFRLMCHVEGVHGYAGVEDVLSGRGLERLHSWVSSRPETDGCDSAASILAAIAAGNDALATETGRIFATLLGRVVGDLALTHLPFGGIFLIGGVARAFTPYLLDFGFAEAFRDKGRFSDFMDNFPIRVIEDDYAALIGCARFLESRGAA